MNNHKHTFTIPAYKEPKFLRECIISLKNQTVESNILLCTSTPNTYLKNIATEFDIPIYVNEKQKGIAADWNFSMNQVDTEYFTIAHQDDLYEPTYTEDILKRVEKNSNFVIAFPNYYELKNGKKVEFTPNLIIKRCLMMKSCILKKNLTSIVGKRWLQAIGNPICCPAVFYHKPLLNGFQFDEEYKVNLDWDAWERMSKFDGSFIWINKTLMSHRIYAESTTSAAIKSNLRYNEDTIIFRRLWPSFIAQILTKFYALSYKGNKT